MMLADAQPTRHHDGMTALHSHDIVAILQPDGFILWEWGVLSAAGMFYCAHAFCETYAVQYEHCRMLCFVLLLGIALLLPLSYGMWEVCLLFCVSLMVCMLLDTYFVEDKSIFMPPAISICVLGLAFLLSAIRQFIVRMM